MPLVLVYFNIITYGKLVYLHPLISALFGLTWELTLLSFDLAYPPFVLIACPRYDLYDIPGRETQVSFRLGLIIV